MQSAVDGCSPPQEAGQGIDDQTGPDTGCGSGDYLPFVSVYPRFRGIAVKGWRQINQQESHGVHFATNVLASEAMTKFMHACDRKDQNPEQNDVGYRLVGEVIKLQVVVPEFRPMAYGNISSESKHSETDEKKLVGKNESYSVVKSG
jgi:hypothetical protein